MRDVANDIELRPSLGEGDDFDVALAVRDALQGACVPEQRITSTACAGKVALAGSVDSIAQRDEAERVIRGLHGVRAVDNGIAVRP